MGQNNFYVLDLLEIDASKKNLNLRCIAGKNGLDRIIKSKDINRPGLALSGFFDHFAYDRIQIIGKGEYLYIKKLIEEKNLENIKKFMEYDIPCIIFTNNEEVPQELIKLADSHNIPILVTTLSSVDIISALFQILGEVFALRTIMHGVLVEVFGIGILIKGKSGIGKSETALELLERGHRLIADDTIEIKNYQDRDLIGRGTRIISHHMEIRGIGIINVKHLFGVGAIRFEKKIQLVIELEEWNPNHEYDRLGTEAKTIDILGIKVPYVLLPVMPGRNIPIIIETAAMNQRLKMMGINSAKEFNKELTDYLESEEIKNTFFEIE
ncbi:MAG TPA: HPr(Ser) kinase/phosphatase [Spirochaetota bacterium]|nr:HPr(Ser) kinase/phosphatase [Spirochaetota bacterium]HOL57347.1 HPr(Ser) kinase/phosphatase [Spirochaetota bacterium]HPP04356.1 HPr(Ser) kinase/phosphatase [Spirochaetota bacterium]